MSIKFKSTVAGALTILAAVAGMTSAADAHHKKHKFGFIVGPPAHDCDFYYWKWQTTGKPKWQYRYYTCMGWW